MAFGRTYKDRSALTFSESHFLDVLTSGISIAGAADVLGISVKTARNRSDTINEKLGVDTMVQAIERWRDRKGMAA